MISFSNNKTKGLIAVIFAAILWSLAGVCIKSMTWGSMTIGCFRSLISIVILLIANSNNKFEINKYDILGAVFGAATSTLYIAAVKLTTAGTAIILQYIAPILVFLFSVIFQHKKPKAYQIIITFVVFGGIVLSFVDNIDASFILGDALGLLSGFTFAGQIIVMNNPKTHATNSMILSCAFAFFINLPFVFFDSNLVFDYTNILWILILGIFQYGLANFLFSKGIQSVDKVEGSILLTMEPILSPIITAFVCGETMGLLAIIGFIIVITSVTMYILIPEISKKLNGNKIK